jgi:hypothetical protein
MATRTPVDTGRTGPSPVITLQAAEVVTEALGEPDRLLAAAAEARGVVALLDHLDERLVGEPAGITAAG